MTICWIEGQICNCTMIHADRRFEHEKMFEYLNPCLSILILVFIFVKKFIFLCYCLLPGDSVFFVLAKISFPTKLYNNYYLSYNQVPRDEKGEPLYDDFICGTCSAVCSFLILYPKSIWVAEKKPAIVSTSDCLIPFIFFYVNEPVHWFFFFVLLI